VNLHNLPPLDKPYQRLAAYQSAYKDELRRVQAALAKAPKDRTNADNNAIAYSRLPGGTAARHP